MRFRPVEFLHQVWAISRAPLAGARPSAPRASEAFELSEIDWLEPLMSVVTST